ncbi:hypothetical protein ACSTGZ_23440, partial [Vibrio parahaemolyticus]
MVDLTAPKLAPRTIVPGLENQWTLVGNVGGTFYWHTNKDAPKGRIVTM